MDDHSPLETDELSDYDIYGRTPPRTKLLRKNRERKQREKYISVASPSSKLERSRTPLFRRFTEGNMIDELAIGEYSDEDEAPKRTNKRHMKLLRGSERDLKLDIASAQAAISENGGRREDANFPITPSYQIESHKRFMSLVGRTIPCKQKACSKEDKRYPAGFGVLEGSGANGGEGDEYLAPRVEFYQTLKALIRMGCGERNPRRAMSREETLWQNELKDLIWLELQAYHADRSPIEEDDYLCTARESVEHVLADIRNYKFQRHSRRYSTQNSDSGVEDDCPGCLALLCPSCLEAQNKAFRDVEKLLKRLEEAENLFPSSKAFAELYPIYSSAEFVGRVKAMCLWYNMTKHQRLKLNILGRLVTLVEDKHGNWLMPGDEIYTGSPSDSNNSTNSSSSDSFTSKPNLITNDLYSIASIAVLLSPKKDNTVSPYRRYIENVLKTRTLDKSLKFLKNLHKNVLRKTKLTLDRPKDSTIFSTTKTLNSDEEELLRYGAWSPEAASLDLPSYRSTFLFLAMVPLEVLHEYLLMRLEQKPENPSPLSVRQLMRELKQGLMVAMEERWRTYGYVAAATSGCDHPIEHVRERLEDFDGCLRRVFADYLEYLERWVFLHKNTFPKNLLDEEFGFSMQVTQHVPDVKDMIGRRFAFICGTILKRIGEKLISRIEDVLEVISKCDDVMLKQNLFSVCRELQSLFNEEREMTLKTMCFIKANIKKDNVPYDSLKFLGESVFAYKCIIPDAIGKIQTLFDHISFVSLDEIDKNALNSRIREILMQVYRFGFEFYREVADTSPSELRPRLVHCMVDFANLWMKFVTERCERGRGMRPRWAFQGLEFLLTVCEPVHTHHVSEEKFDKLKRDMDICISHVIGTTAPSTPDSGFHSASSRSSLDQIRARSRGSSPSPRPYYKSQRSKGRKTSAEQQSPSTEFFDAVTLDTSYKKEEADSAPIEIRFPPKPHADRLREAVEALEAELDNDLIKQNLIGKVVHRKATGKNIPRKNVTFSWQRGIKIGQGRFGKVYTAVNNNTGDLMAVKEIALQHNDTATIKRVAEEMKILEGIVHKNLVRYYGMEVHKDEMLLFMEYCSEGTLENLIADTEKGLPELLVRRCTFQLVSGVACLHEHGIVHRDIKTANIFLTDGGNCLKIGDFGCAAKIKSNTTMPGELKGFVGTQAYMAPEVFTKNMSEGHGRAADIWSIGCVVVEMASGKRPWSEYDSNFQIMFKVGMGQSPDPPDDMIDEGLDFLDMCFKHDPKERATARELLANNFVKIGEDLI
ncbi:unnamed protein product [Phaedon cochleariae]|uniref:Mitogen-activated protein kinase kinase kinase 4 n=1 Tax=Phaedon cochleariae TaxID=80249 RepID=A0A9N9SK40_PHACE|nr:unnamed protein product [Phaedon cochleariae]